MVSCSTKFNRATWSSCGVPSSDVPTAYGLFFLREPENHQQNMEDLWGFIGDLWGFMAIYRGFIGDL
jgi:hypothetical protein